MKCLFRKVTGECWHCGQWDAIWRAVAICKLRFGDRMLSGDDVCRDMTVPGNFFEPNPGTLQYWQECQALYNDDIDTRLMFVFQSPWPQLSVPGERQELCDENKRSKSDFCVEVEGGCVEGWRTWATYNPNARKLLDARQATGLGVFAGIFLDYRNSWMTNVVKCGTVPEVAKTHCPDGLLIKEIALIKPRVLASFHRDTWRWVNDFLRSRRSALERLYHPDEPPRRAFYFEHYTRRGHKLKAAQWRSQLELAEGRMPLAPVWLHDTPTHRPLV